MTTIAYDRSVKDLIAGLDATGHVTHIAHKKTSVTLHHNGGRLSHEGVLQVWKTRRASAHFDVDRAGDVAQYVRVNEYAWATGNTEGNYSSISIEMANEFLAPTWQVADITWKNAARLGGWLCARVIGERPSSSNFFVHSHWCSTECAGPYIGKIWSDVLLEANNAYDHFIGTSSPAPPVTPAPTTPSSGRILMKGSKGDDVAHIQLFLRNTFPAYRNSVTWRRGELIGVDSVYGNQTEAWVREFQHRVGITVDGRVGPETIREFRKYGYRY